MSATAPETSRRPRVGRLRFGSALRLYLIRLRGRRIQELLAILGIAIGVALLYASQVASTSLSGPVKAINNGLVGRSQLQILSRANVGMPADVYNKVLAIPGVRRAAPALQLSGNLEGPRGQRGVMVFGADPRIVQLKGDLLKGFSSDDAARQEAVILPKPIAEAIGVGVGDDVRLEVDGRTVAQPVVVSGRDEIGALSDTAVALVPLPYLQRLAHADGQVSRILVEADPGRVDQVRSGLDRLAAGRWNVAPSSFETLLFNKAASPTAQATLVFAIVSALVGFLFAACALLVTASERQRLAAQQRALGYPPVATLTTLLVDVAVVGGAGVVLGLGLGELLSRTGFSSDVSFLAGAFPTGDVRVVTWQSVAVAAAAGLLAAAIGVLLPVRRAVFTTMPFHFRPASTAQSAGSGGAGWALRFVAICSLVLAFVVAAFWPSAVVAGLAALGVGMVCALPTIVDGTASLIERLNLRARTSSALQLALQHIRAPQLRSRTLAIATVGAVAVFGAASLEGARLNLTAGLSADVHELNAAAPIWITPRGAGEVFGTMPFDARGAVAVVRRTEGVGRVDAYRAGLVDVGPWRTWMIGTPAASPAPLPLEQIVEGDGPATIRRLRQGGWVTLSKAIADDLDAGIGDVVTLPTPHPLRVRVAAITTNLGWSGGAVVVSAADFAASWEGGGVAALHVTPAAGVGADQLQRRIAGALGGASAALRVETARQRDARQLNSALGGLERLKQIARLTLLAALVAMSAAMTGLLWQHRPGLAALKAHGLSTRLLWGSLILEAVILFATATLTGGVFSLLGQVLGSHGVQVITGFPTDNRLQPATTIEAVALVAGASLLTVMLPGYLVARVRPRFKG
ncbi:ABC transporter permease [Conexibacter woesei]|uniref:ABC transporter permease n=1 Tax=Conexibacter woesei TaxID=191495 RepID=UPI000414EBEC|nr:ABC transporter permease [Conexibacter woesei]